MPGDLLVTGDLLPVGAEAEASSTSQPVRHERTPVPRSDHHAVRAAPCNEGDAAVAAKELMVKLRVTAYGLIHVSSHWRNVDRLQWDGKEVADEEICASLTPHGQLLGITDLDPGAA